jgi:uncharacterized protein (DUF1778 family)
LIDHAANPLGKNRSDFMLEAACERASHSAGQAFFSLDENRFRQLTTLLDAPQDANPGLEHLMTIKVPWGTGNAFDRSHIERVLRTEITPPLGKTLCQIKPELLQLNQLSVGALSQPRQFHFLWRYYPASSTVQFPF